MLCDSAEMRSRCEGISRCCRFSLEITLGTAHPALSEMPRCLRDRARGTCVCTPLKSPLTARDHLTHTQAIMVAVNSVNQCPYCDGLHGELARLVGLGDAAVELRGCKDAPSAAAAMKSVTLPSVVPAVTYARIAGEADGKGAKEAAAYAALVDAEGASRAASIKALCFFLMWGSMTGNTINATKKRLIGLSPMSGLTLFSSLFTLYYGPLFLIVFAVNTMISYLPRMASQTWFFKVITEPSPARADFPPRRGPSPDGARSTRLCTYTPAPPVPPLAHGLTRGGARAADGRRSMDPRRHVDLPPRCHGRRAQDHHHDRGRWQGRGDRGDQWPCERRDKWQVP